MVLRGSRGLRGRRVPENEENRQVVEVGALDGDTDLLVVVHQILGQMPG